jgi:hypothetical protein
MPSILLRTPITFEVPGHATHAPMVHASVNGVATKLILDTGCTDHILTMELVSRAGLPAEPGEVGTDAAGAAVESWSVGSLPFTIGDLTLPLHNVVAFHGPEPFEGWGIGGFLSPQHLHPTASVILDLAGSELSITDGDPAEIGAELIGQHPELRPLWLGREPGDTTVQIRAAIEPFAPVVTMLDSGGKATEFADSAVPGLGTDILEAGGRGVSGTQVHGSVVTDQVLRIGDATLPLPRLFVRPSSSAAAPGLVGMDLLRGTVLMVGADLDRRVLWLVPRTS